MMIYRLQYSVDFVLSFMVSLTSCLFKWLYLGSLQIALSALSNVSSGLYM